MSSAEPRERQPRVSVVIPNFNGMLHLPECLACLSAQSFDDFEIVMVDNASTDASVAWVQEHHSDVRIVQRPINGGPARSTNDGIRASRGEYVVILDNDTAFGPEWLSVLVEAMDQHPEYDFGVSMVLVHGKSDFLQYAGELYSITRLCSVSRGFSRPAAAYSRMQRVVVATGNGAIHRREIFVEVGLYDEDYYAMFEDTDFSLRCLIKGKRCLYIPDARIWHKIGLTGQLSVSAEAHLAFIRNGAMTAAKNLPMPLLAIGLMAVGWHDFRSTFPLRPQYYRSYPELLCKSLARAKARWAGLRTGWAKRPSVWESRENSRREVYRWLLRGEGPI